MIAWFVRLMLGVQDRDTVESAVNRPGCADKHNSRHLLVLLCCVHLLVFLLQAPHAHLREGHVPRRAGSRISSAPRCMRAGSAAAVSIVLAEGGLAHVLLQRPVQLSQNRLQLKESNVCVHANTLCAGKHGSLPMLNHTLLPLHACSALQAVDTKCPAPCVTYHVLCMSVIVR
jgi:hypothetical protein